MLNKLVMQLPPFLKNAHLPDFILNLIIIGAALLLGRIIKFILALFVKKKADQTIKYSFFYSTLKYLGKPFNYFLPLLVLNMSLPFMRMQGIYILRFEKVLEIALTICFAWILINTINIAQDYTFHKFDLKKADNLKERKIRTQLQYIRHFVNALIILLTIAAILLSFHSVRKIGAGLVAGVGVGGIIIGFAAQKSLSNILAGFQIAFTQPIRIDDVLVVEGEWGRVEEITLTYVVLRIWDLRRLILPINYFIEKPFQNWTRASSEILGTVFIYTDYSIPVNKLRDELSRLLRESKLWDGKVIGLQITDSKEKTMEIRALMSAANSSDSFDLRCYVRENLINYIQQNYPESLPKTRTEIYGSLSPELPEKT